MKFAIALFLTLPLLSACAPELIDGKTAFSLAAPGVPVIEKTDQKAAALEMERGMCPQLNNIANQCLITRDESRAMSTAN